MTSAIFLLSTGLAGAGAAPGLGVSQHGHLSCESWFCTMHVGHDQPLLFLNNSLSGFTLADCVCSELFFAELASEVAAVFSLLVVVVVSLLRESVDDEDLARKSNTLPCFSSAAGFVVNITDVSKK